MLYMAAAKFSALPPHPFLLYAALILSNFPVQLFFISRSRGKESRVISFDDLSTSPRIITSARFPVTSPLVKAISADLSSDPINKYTSKLVISFSNSLNTRTLSISDISSSVKTNSSMDEIDS